MARKGKVDVFELLHMEVDGVCGLHLYMPYLRTCNAKDVDSRCRRFVMFLRWASSKSDFHWDYTVLPRYAEHLKSLGNAERTVSDKLSNIRQFLLTAEECNIIPKCVYYAKRGRKPKANTSTSILNALAIPEKRPIFTDSSKVKSLNKPTLFIPKGYRKTFLYDLFGVCKDKPFSFDRMKKAYRKLATVLHPDHEHGSQERFIACKDAYDFLSDTVHRVSYELYVIDGKNHQDVSSFVRSVYDRIGGYSTLRFCSSEL